MKRYLLALGLMVSPSMAWAACLPSQATPGQEGCLPVSTTAAPTDYIRILQPGQFPASSRLIQISNLSVALGGSFLPLTGGTVTGPVILSAAGTGLSVTGNLVVGGTLSAAKQGPIFFADQYGVVANGVTSNDAAMKAVGLVCSAVGGKVLLPYGDILMSGAGANTTTIENCKWEGSGIPGGYVNSRPSNGTRVLLTSTTIKPFILKSSWSLEGINFFYPNQTTGTTPYPPLFSDDGGTNVSFGYIHNIIVANAYDAFAATVNVDWSNIDGSDSSIYAVNDGFRLNSTGDSWRLTNIHFTHGPWASMAGYPGVASALNAANHNNSILHVTAGSGSVTWALSNSSSFSWRYGVRVDSGAYFVNSNIDVVWDGVLTQIDTSAGGCMNNTVFSGSGLAAYVPQFDTSGGVTVQNIVAPMFNYGSNVTNCGAPTLRKVSVAGPVVGDFVKSGGQNVMIDGATVLFGASATVADYYAVHVTANGGGTGISVRGMDVAGAGANLTKMHGIKADVGMNLVSVDGNTFLNLNDSLDIQLTGGANTFINNVARQTAGANTIKLGGTMPFLYANNLLDKPPGVTITGGGTGATVVGRMAGFIQLGSTATTTVFLTLPFRTPDPIGGVCTFGSSNSLTIYASPVGTGPVTWNIASSGNMQGSQLFFNCNTQQ